MKVFEILIEASDFPSSNRYKPFVIPVKHSGPPSQEIADADGTYILLELMGKWWRK